MITSVIRWSARNVFLVALATVFVTLAGIYAVSRVPLDAIPDLSDVQVIVYTEYSGQAPQVVEDQVTYPLTTAMLSVPKSRVVRGFSFFGVSFVYVIFEDGTDLYWARSRVLEYLSSAARRLPAGVAPSLGPDATGVGWVYQYVVRGAQKSLAELRTVQDWYVRYGIAKTEGVAEVASVGGFVKQYSVVIDPRRLQALGIPLAKIREALRTSNMDVADARWSLPKPSSRCAGAATSRACPTWNRSSSRMSAACLCCSGTWPGSSLLPTNAAA
jgi:Cu(I)/Ag(I) efflux system membrane protein CusA/SilA